MIVRRVRYFAEQTLLAMGRSALVQVVAMGTISVALFVVCAFGTIMINLDRAADQWGREMGLVAFFEKGLQPAVVKTTVDRVEAWPEVRSVVHRTRKDALDELRLTLGEDADLLAGLGSHVLPATLELVLEPNHRSLENRSELARRLAIVPGLSQVSRIDYGADLVKRVGQVRNVMSIGGLVVGALVLLSVLFIISNTVRLTLFARRDEIEIMQLVGATNTFIRVPFYLEGFLQGSLSALFAGAATWSLASLMHASSAGWANTLLGGNFVFLAPPVLIAFVVGSGMVGILASHLAVQRYLEGDG